MQPLRGIVVAAVEQAVAAPICTRHLGDLGARVIKVENRAGGDFARDYDDAVRGMSAYFAWANRNKESVALDLKHPAGREALARLVRRADVVVQNLAPGAAARLGLDPAELRAARPELITVDISGRAGAGRHRGTGPARRPAGPGRVTSVRGAVRSGMDVVATVLPLRTAVLPRSSAAFQQAIEARRQQGHGRTHQA